MRTLSSRRAPHLAIAAALCATCLLSACDSGVDPATLLASATAAEERGDMRAAVIELKNLLQANPEHGEARARLGKVYLKLGQGAAALKEFEQAQRFGHKSDELTRDLLGARLLLGEFEAVLGTLSTMGEAGRTDEMMILRAQAQLGLRRADAAENTYKTILGRSPSNAQAQRGLARVALSKRDLEGANKLLDLSLDTNRDDLQSWLLKGELELSRGRFDAALSALRAAEKLASQSAAVRIGLARALLGLQRTDDADAYLAELHKASPNHPLVNYLRGLAAHQRGDLDKAQEALRDVLRVQPSHPQSLLLMGSMQYTAGEYRQAEDALLRFVKQVPKHLPARKLLAAVQLRLSQPDDAVATLQQSLSEAPDDPQLLAMLGSAHLARREFEKGSELLRRAAELDPNAAAIRTQLAVSHMASGSSDKAVDALTTAVELDPSFTRADLLLIFTHLRNRDWKQAEAAARKLIDKQPGDPVPLNLLGAALAGQGQPDAARAQFELALAADPGYANAALNLAGLDVQAGNTDAAIARYKSVLAAQPDHEQATLALAQLLSRSQGNLAQAIKLLEDLRGRNTKALRARMVLTNIYLRTRDAPAALRVAEEAQKLAPEAAAVKLLLGRALAASGDMNRALSVFTALSAEQPNSPEVHYRLGMTRLRSNRLEEGKASLERALSLNGRHLGAMVALGNLAVRTGELEVARQLATRLQQTFPTSIAGAVLQGDALVRAGSLEDAYKIYTQAFERVPSSALLLKRYGVLSRSGNSTLAAKLLEDWLEAHPGDGAVRLTVASEAHQSGDIDRATRLYEQVIKDSPDSIMALNNLAWLYYERDDKRALELAARAYELAGSRAEIADTQGWLLVQSGQVERGLKILERAAKAAPDAADIQYHLAAALAKADDKARAKQILDQILASGEAFNERDNAAELLKTL